MVVMDYADGEQFFHKFPQATPAKIFEEISEALKSLHEGGLVFSDLRSPNILVIDQHHDKLVDLDWCGKAGEGGVSGRHQCWGHQTAGGSLSWLLPGVRARQRDVSEIVVERLR